MNKLGVSIKSFVGHWVAGAVRLWATEIAVPARAEGMYGRVGRRLPTSARPVASMANGERCNHGGAAKMQIAFAGVWKCVVMINGEVAG